MYHRVKPEQALIRSGIGGTVVNFSGIWVLPIVHRLQVMDISAKKVAIDRAGKKGLSCKDHIRADIKLALHLRVRPTLEDVLQVYQTLGAERASEEKVVFARFEALIVEAMKTAARSYDFKDLVDTPSTLR